MPQGDSRTAPQATRAKSLKSIQDPARHGSTSQGERAFSVISTFLSGIMAISVSQVLGAPLKLVDAKLYQNYMAWTKESFAVLVTAITQWWSPTIIRVSGDESMKGQLFQMPDGSLRCNFPHRVVMMANHQLYTDWLYLWWIAYTNKMHGHVYIVLKESLRQLPILGWGMQFYNFIFLSRKWETDQARLAHQLGNLHDSQDPMWLLIFPEGTNLSAFTREKSAAWAAKNGMPDMQHQLLPRSTGLRFCLRQLAASTNWLYDCTIAYEGVPRGLYGQDVFTLKSSFIDGRPPKSVNLFWRRMKISTIPHSNDKAFERWLLNRWREKDYMLEYFARFGRFPDCPAKDLTTMVRRQKVPKHANVITASLRGGGWEEFLSIFGPITSAAGALGSIDLTEPLDLEEILLKAARSHPFGLASDGAGKGSISDSSRAFVERALQAAIQRTQLPRSVMTSLLSTTSGPQMRHIGVAKVNTAGEKAQQVTERKKKLLEPQKSALQHSQQPNTISVTPRIERGKKSLVDRKI